MTIIIKHPHYVAANEGLNIGVLGKLQLVYNFLSIDSQFLGSKRVQCSLSTSEVPPYRPLFRRRWIHIWPGRQSTGRRPFIE